MAWPGRRADAASRRRYTIHEMSPEDVIDQSKVPEPLALGLMMAAWAGGFALLAYNLMFALCPACDFPDVCVCIGGFLGVTFLVFAARIVFRPAIGARATYLVACLAAPIAAGLAFHTWSAGGPAGPTVVATGSVLLTLAAPSVRRVARRVARSRSGRLGEDARIVLDDLPDVPRAWDGRRTPGPVLVWMTEETAPGYRAHGMGDILSVQSGTRIQALDRAYFIRGWFGAAALLAAAVAIGLAGSWWPHDSAFPYTW